MEVRLVFYGAALIQKFLWWNSWAKISAISTPVDNTAQTRNMNIQPSSEQEYFVVLWDKMYEMPVFMFCSLS